MRPFDAPVRVLNGDLGRLGLRALDASSGDFFDPATAVECLRRWRTYRERVSGRPGR